MLWTIFVIGLLLILAEWLRSCPFYWSGQNVHWMIPWPVLGNTARSLTRPFSDFWLDFYNNTKGHKLVGYHMFSHPAIFVRDPAYINQVMVSDIESFSSRGIHSSPDDFFSRSIFVTEGEEWRLARSKMTPYFSPARIKGTWSIVENAVDSFMKELEQRRRLGTVEIDNESMKLSTDVVVASAFGLQPDSFVNKDSFFFTLQRELTGFMFGLRLMLGILAPGLYNFLGLRSFKISTDEKLRSFVDQVLESRTRGEGVRADFMQGMVQLYQQHIQSGSTDKIKYNHDGTRVATFDKEGVTAQCVMMFLAGTDTTGHSISFLLYEMAMNQQVQSKLREEIKQALEDSDGSLSYEKLTQMSYLAMVCSESLRKYPAAPAMPRKCTRSTRLGDIKIAKDTRVILPIIGVHRDPQYYPDPDKFDPERFAPASASQRVPGTFIPFGSGPRACIGMKLAEIEMKLVVCKVLSKYRLTPCSETPTAITEYGFGPLLSPLNGIKLNVELL